MGEHGTRTYILRKYFCSTWHLVYSTSCCLHIKPGLCIPGICMYPTTSGAVQQYTQSPFWFFILLIEIPVVLLWYKLCGEAISFDKLILKTENGGFSSFAGVFDPGNGRIGPAVLIFQLAFLRDASNGIGRFLRIASFFFSMHRGFLKISFGCYLSEKQVIFSDETASYIRNWFYDIFFKIRTHILKKRSTPLDASRKKASRNLRTAGPILPVPGSNTPAKVLKPPFSVFRISLL